MARVEKMLLSGEWVDMTEKTDFLRKGDVVRFFNDAGDRVVHLYTAQGVFVADVTGQLVDRGSGGVVTVDTWSLTRAPVQGLDAPTRTGHSCFPIGDAHSWAPAA